MRQNFKSIYVVHEDDILSQLKQEHDEYSIF